jgi:para-nitrobenzyl esterase
MAFLPTGDGEVVPDSPRPTAAVPMLFGTNVDETRLLGLRDPHRLDLNDGGLLRRVSRNFGEAAPSVIEAVRSARARRGEPVTPSDLWHAIDTERFFRVPTTRDADAHAELGHPTWVYLFEYRSPMLDGWLGACHVLEIPFVFGLQGTEDLKSLTGSGPPADTLSTEMMAAWVGFAHTGELPWQRHDPDDRPTWVFGERSRLEFAPREAERKAVAAALGG